MNRRFQFPIYVLFLISLLVGISSGDALAAIISRNQELEMGKQAAQEIQAHYPRSTDTKLNDLVAGIGKKLVPVSDRELPTTFMVLETKEVNACAVPGYVFVYRGLIDLIGGDRDQLAAVIAHEVAHNARRHAAKQIERQLGASLALSLITGGRKRTAQLASSLTNFALLGYGRSQELDADHQGMIYMKRAGYSPQGMTQFFQKLKSTEKREAKGLMVYFQTHPPTSERLQRSEQELQEILAGKIR